MEAEREVVEEEGGGGVVGELSGDVQDEVEDGLGDEKLEHLDDEQVDFVVLVVQVLANEGDELLPDLGPGGLAAHLLHPRLLNREVLAAVGLVEVHELQLQQPLHSTPLTTRYCSEVSTALLDLAYSPSLNTISSFPTTTRSAPTLLPSASADSVLRTNDLYFLFTWPSSFSPYSTSSAINFDSSLID